MDVVVILEPLHVPVEPGRTATATVRIRNTGAIVDQFTLEPIGRGARWITIDPQRLSLFPGAEGTALVRLAPPRAAEPPAGPLAFAVRVTSRASGATASEEAVADVRPFADIALRVVPETSHGQRGARHEIRLANRGNASVRAEIESSDPDEQLELEVATPVVTVESGGSAVVPLRVATRRARWRGPAVRMPFAVTARTGSMPPLVDRAAFEQRPVISGLTPVLTLAVASVAVMAVLMGSGVLPRWLTGGLESASGTSPPTMGPTAPAGSVEPTSLPTDPVETDPAETEPAETDAPTPEPTAPATEPPATAPPATRAPTAQPTTVPVPGACAGAVPPDSHYALSGAQQIAFGVPMCLFEVVLERIGTGSGPVRLVAGERELLAFDMADFTLVGAPDPGGGESRIVVFDPVMPIGRDEPFWLDLSGCTGSACGQFWAMLALVPIP